MPKFSANDVKGNKVTEAALRHQANIVSTWASWSYQSTVMQQRIRQLKKRYGDRLGVVSICLDSRPQDCRQRITRDSLKWQTVCDGKIWDTPLLETFGLADVPGNVVIDGKGRIVARNLSVQRLEERINNILK